MTIFSSFSVNFTPCYHTILAINCAMHQIGSLIWNKHDKHMVKMTILQKRLVVLTAEWLPWLEETVIKRSLFGIRG